MSSGKKSGRSSYCFHSLDWIDTGGIGAHRSKMEIIDRARELASKSGVSKQALTPELMTSFLAIAVEIDKSDAIRRLSDAIEKVTDHGIEIRITGGPNSVEFPIRVQK